MLYENSYGDFLKFKRKLKIGGIMKAILINIIASIPTVYILLLFSRIFKELGHLTMYKILFKDDNYKITIGFGKALIHTKKWSINRIPILSSINYGDKFKRGTYKSIATHIGGALGTIVFILCLSPLIYLVNKRPELIIIMNSNIFPMAILRTVQILLFSLYFTILPLQIPFLIDGGYVSDGVYIINDIRNIKASKEVDR